MSVEIRQGDALAVLKTLPSEHFHCVVTSPPYYGLRDYGTGTWEGGDPACDHRAPNRFDYPIGDKQASHGGSAKIACYRDTCGKCGAQRIDQQIGLESTPDEWCARLVEVFREVRRVLRADGVCFVNIGDSYCNAGSSRNGEGLDGVRRGGATGADGACGYKNRDPRYALRHHGIKHKDLIGAPWMLAFALRADGWWLRSEIIWNKPNPMPESVNSRPTKAHEQVFMLTKSGETTFWQHRDLPGTRARPEPDYRWVHKETGEEVAEDPGDPENWKRINLWSGRDYFYDADAVRETRSDTPGAQAWARIRDPEKNFAKQSSASVAMNGGPHAGGNDRGIDAGRNLRSVWTIATDPLPSIEVDGEKLDHYASFPISLASRCILAGTSGRGCCPECGAPWARTVERGEPVQQHWAPGTQEKIDIAQGRHGATSVFNTGFLCPTQTTGWRPTCSCSLGDMAGDYRASVHPHIAEQPQPPIPCRVLDPFGGSGRTALAAEELGRDCTLIELNPASVTMAHAQLERAKARRMIGDAERLPVAAGQLGLFE